MKLLEDKRVHHKYLVNGTPRNCAFCGNPLKGEIIRVGERYYCEETCAANAPEKHRSYQ